MSKNTTSAYTLGSGVTAINPRYKRVARAPLPSDTAFSQGQVWIRTDVQEVYMLIGFENGNANWESIVSPPASETTPGVIAIATDAEAVAGVVDNKALVPSNLEPVFSSPPAIGDIAPNEAGFTQVDFSPSVAPAHKPGRLFYDTDTDALTFYNSETDISLQIGEENWIKVRNETGDTLTNGTIVYLNGSSLDMPLVEKAIASSHDASHALGVVTHTIGNNSDGYITSFGLVRGLDTNLFTGGEAIFLSATVEGGVTTTPPTNKDYIVRIGFIAAVSVTDGSFLVNIEHAGNIEFSHGYTNNPTGFLDPDTDVQISFVDGTRTFTIEPQGDSYSYWSEGIRYDKTAPEDIIVPDTNGLHFIYYDGDTLIETDTFNLDIITKFAYVSVIDWNVAEAKNIYIADEFKHTTKMGSLTHSYLHNTRGFALEAGGGLADIIADGTGNLDSEAQFGNEATIAWDEDARFSYLARTSTSNIGLYFKEGPDLSFVWNLDDISSFPIMTAGTGRAAYNELTGGNWVQTEVPNNNFVLAHVFVYNDSGRKYGAIQGEDFYTTINNARDGAITELGDIIAAGRVPDEIKFLGTIIYQTSDVYGNTVKSRIRTTDGGFDYIDLRDEPISIGGSAGVISDHGALSGLGDDDHLQYLLTDGSRTLTGPMDMGSQSLTNVNIDSGVITGITDLLVADGGTGASTNTIAFDNLSPATTEGDIIYHNGTNNVRLPKGTSEQFLAMNTGATAPEWSGTDQLAKAWAVFDMAELPGAALITSFNVSSLTDNDIGDWRVTYTNPVTNPNHCWQGNVFSTTGTFGWVLNRRGNLTVDYSEYICKRMNITTFQSDDRVVSVTVFDN